MVAIKACKPPTTVKELQRFLGMVNYYRCFIPSAAQHLAGLFDALKGKPKVLKWDEACQTSFEAIKSALSAATLLHHPRKDATLALTTDASKVAVGGVLEQMGPQGWEPLAFYSSKLHKHQRDWPPYDRELLGAFKSIRHFRPMVEGRPFILFTDHLSLVPSIAKKTEPQTARQTYQLSVIAEHTTDLRYIQGKANVVADALSRPPESEACRAAQGRDLEGVAIVTTPEAQSSNETTIQEQTPNPARTPAENTPEAQESLHTVVNAIGQHGIDMREMARDQPLDQDYRRLMGDARTSLHMRKVDLGGVKLVVDVSNGPPRPFVPFSWRRRVFDAIHGLGHPGVERTRQSVSANFVWPSVREDTSRWARECIDCQRAKVRRHTVPEIGNFEVPAKRFHHINLDIVTMPRSNGFQYLLTAVDRFTRWPVAIPMPDATTESVLDAFAHGWVATYGVPASITTDRGAQFQGSTWKQLMRTWGIKSHHTAAYHPEANGLVERFHRRLKESILALGHDAPNDWYWQLPCSLLAIRTTLKPDVGAAPCELVFGDALAVPGQLLSARPAEEEQGQQRTQTQDNLRLEVERLQPKQTSAHRRPQIHIPEDLRDCTHVFVRRGGLHSSLVTPYTGPHRVVSRTANNFRVDFPGRGTEDIALARLKPAHMSIDDREQEDSDDGQPPPQPGRRPGPRTRMPEATDRVTRRTPAETPVKQEVEQEEVQDVQPSTSRGRDGTPERPDAQDQQAQVPVRPRHPRFFSKPDPRHFSYRRRPDVNYAVILKEIMKRNS